MYSTHTKKKAFCVSKMSSGPLPEGEVSRKFAFDDSTVSFSIILIMIIIILFSLKSFAFSFFSSMFWQFVPLHLFMTLLSMCHMNPFILY